MTTYDVCVIGAGPAGITLSNLLGKDGFKVALIEQKAIENCWISPGKMLTFPESLELLRRVGIHLNANEYWFIPGIKVFGTRAEVITIDVKLIGLNRVAISKKVSETLDENIDLFDNTRAISVKLPSTRGESLTIRTKTGITIDCSLVVDASGTLSNIRQELNKRLDKWHISRDMLSIEHLFIGRSRKADTNDFTSLNIIIDKRISSELIYITSMGNNISKKSKEGIIVSIREPANFTKRPKIKNRAEFLNKIHLKFDEMKYLNTIVHPAYHPFLDLVDDGILLLGEAAFQANPIISSGIYESLLSAHIAYLAIRKLDLMFPPSREALWQYNKLYFKNAGKYQLAFYILRKLMIKFNNDDIIDFIRILPSSIPKPDFSTYNDVFGIVAHAMKSRVFWRIYEFANIVRRVLKHSERYPDTPDNFNEWAYKLKQLLSQTERIY